MNAAPTNPFPGMNPYLEEHWTDVHPRLLIYASGQLHRGVPAGFRVRVEQELMVDETSKRADAVPDISVWSKTEAARGGAAVLERAVAGAHPVRVQLPPRPRRHLAISDERGHLVTVIEMLSPSNKRGRDSASYARKRESFMAAGVNLVEIDLVRRGGLALLLFEEERMAELAGVAAQPPPYLVSVYRDTDPHAREIYPISLRERLPVISVPLRPQDADVPLELQPLIEQCYTEGGYADTDYTQDPVPPIEGSDKAWLDELLKSKALR